MQAPSPSFGWRVVWAAFVLAVFAWGLSFYGPPVLLHAIHAARGWPVALIAAAITCHFLLGAVVVANLAALHARFGVAAATRAGAVATALGFVGWAAAETPWQLFAATLLSGCGWALTGAAAINAIVAPWFGDRRPAALGAAYNGASVGGVVFSPLWVAAIGALGLVGAAAAIGVAMMVSVWLLAGRVFAVRPPPMAHAAGPAGLPGRALWRHARFRSLSLATSLGLFAQIGLIAHLFSLLVPAFGAQGAGLVAGMATAAAIIGRTALGALLRPGIDRRRAAAVNYAVQVAGSLVLLAAGGVSVPLLLLGVALFGLGLGNAASMPALIAQSDFAPADAARAVALVTACSQACYAFAPALFGALRGEHGTWLFVAAGVIQAAAAAAVLRRGSA